MSTPADPFAVMRTRQYAVLLIMAAVLGVVISFLVYWYLKLVTDIADLGLHRPAQGRRLSR